MKQQLNERLKALRIKCGLSVQEAAERAGITKAHLYKIEDGESKPSVEVLSRLCDGYGIKLSQFFAGDSHSVADKLRRYRVTASVVGTGETFSVDTLAWTPQQALEDVRCYLKSNNVGLHKLVWEHIDAEDYYATGR